MARDWLNVIASWAAASSPSLTPTPPSSPSWRRRAASGGSPSASAPMGVGKFTGHWQESDSRVWNAWGMPTRFLIPSFRDSCFAISFCDDPEVCGVVEANVNAGDPKGDGKSWLHATILDDSEEAKDKEKERWWLGKRSRDSR